MYKRICNASDKKKFLETRRDYFTGSDIAMLMRFLVDGETKYYENSIFEFTKNKSKTIKVTPEKQAMFNKGHIVEDLIFDRKQELFKDCILDQNNMYASEIYTFLSCTTDIEVYKNNALHHIVEVKSCNSIDNQELYKSGNHSSIYQCALQNIILGVPVKLECYSFDSSDDIKDEDVHLFHTETIDSEHKAVKAILENIDVLREFFGKYCSDFEPIERKVIDFKDTITRYIKAKSTLEFIEGFKDQIKEISVQNNFDEYFSTFKTKVYDDETLERIKHIKNNSDFSIRKIEYTKILATKVYKNIKESCLMPLNEIIKGRIEGIQSKEDIISINNYVLRYLESNNFLKIESESFKNRLSFTKALKAKIDEMKNSLDGILDKHKFVEDEATGIYLHKSTLKLKEIPKEIKESIDVIKKDSPFEYKISYRIKGI